MIQRIDEGLAMKWFVRLLWAILIAAAVAPLVYSIARAQQAKAPPLAVTDPPVPLTPAAPSQPAQVTPPGSEVYTQAEIQALLGAQSAQDAKTCEETHVRLENAITGAAGPLAKLRAHLQRQVAPPATPAP